MDLAIPGPETPGCRWPTSGSLRLLVLVTVRGVPEFAVWTVTFGVSATLDTPATIPGISTIPLASRTAS